MFRGQIRDLMKLEGQLFHTPQRAAGISTKSIIQSHQIIEVIKEKIIRH